MELEFSARGRKVLGLAGFRAERPETRRITSEDLLSALIDAEGVARCVLQVVFGVRPRLVALREPSSAPLTFTTQALRVLELAAEERTRLGALPCAEPGIGPGHLLIALCRTESGRRSLSWLGLDPEEVRGEVLELLGADPAVSPPNQR